MKNVSILTSKLPPLGADVNAVLRRSVQRKRALGTLFQSFHGFWKSPCISYIVSLLNHKPNVFFLVKQCFLRVREYLKMQVCYTAL